LNLARVSSLLWIAGIRNRARRQIQRMRQPKYLIATLVGAFYFWTVFGRRIHLSGARMQVPTQSLHLIEAVLVAIALATIAGAWLFGSDRAEVAFTEAEVQFLFPAPMTRRKLLMYRLSKAVVRTFWGVLLITLFSVGSLTGHPVLFLLGGWVALSTMMLHLTGAALTRSSLVEAGRSGLKRRLGTLLVLAAVISALIWWALRAPKPATPGQWTLESAAAWLDAVMTTPPLAWVLFPVRAPIQLALATSLRSFLTALPAALLVAAIHYLWVISSNVSFEEASVEAAERRARAAESRRTGKDQAPPVGKARGVPFRLSASGRPEVALIWKNLIAAMRVSVPRTLLFFFLAGASIAVSMVGRFGLPMASGTACVVVAAFLTFLGPNAMRIDLRHDLPQIDILRSLPMSGRQVMWAELLGPGLVLAALQWILILAALILTAGEAIPLWPQLNLPRRAAAALSLALLAPAISFANLLVQNAGVLLFPSWVAIDPAASRGIEALGQRLLTLAGTMLVLVVAVFPGAILGAAVWALLQRQWGFFALPCASVVFCAVIAAEFHFAVRVLGKLFDRFDVTLP
jgi:hypothetical protein